LYQQTSTKSWLPYGVLVVVAREELSIAHITLGVEMVVAMRKELLM
jgi:hypothetical protein